MFNKDLYEMCFAKGSGKRNALVFASLALLLVPIVSQDVFAQTAPTVFLNDNFTGSLDGWKFSSSTGGLNNTSGYSLTLDAATGKPAPSAHISGDAWTGTCSPFGMAKSVSILSYAGGPLTLAFDWRASSGFTGSQTTNAFVTVYNADTGVQLFTHQLVGGGTFDTDWQHFSQDISGNLTGAKNISINLHLIDCWIDNWNENNWYDNVQLFAGSIPPSPPTNLVATALSSSQIYLSWSAPVIGNPTGYKIERSADNGTTWSTVIPNTGSTATTYTNSGLASSTTYGYRVSGINSGGTGSPSIAAFATTLSSNVFMNDNFNSGLDGWQFSGSTGVFGGNNTSGYSLTLDTTTGVPAPSAHISGDAWTGTCSPFGMSKVVSISQYASGPLTLAFNWRASSSFTGSQTTNAFVTVSDADTGRQLFANQLVGGGTYDTNWQYYSKDISSYVEGASKKLDVNLHLIDCWAANWNENNWYDNVQLFAGPTLHPGNSRAPSAPLHEDLNMTRGNSTSP